MNRRNLIAVVLVASSLATTPVVIASPVVSSSSVHAMFGGGKTAKTKVVRLTLNNPSSTDRRILAGDRALTIAAGTSVTLDLPVGTRITVDDTAKSLILEVIARNDGTTVTLR